MAHPAVVIICAFASAVAYLTTLATCIVWCVGDTDVEDPHLLDYAADDGAHAPDSARGPARAV